MKLKCMHCFKYTTLLWVILFGLNTTAVGAVLSITAPAPATIEVRYSTDLSHVEVVQDGIVTSSNLASTVTSIDYTGTTGSDIFINHTDIDSVMNALLGADILVGGSGADEINGQSGTDLLIGGVGADTLNGGDSNDLIIHGSTVYDARISELLAIQSIWTDGSLTAQEKIDALTFGTNGVLLNYTVGSITNDETADTLTGGAGVEDLFITGYDDVVTDLEGGEEAYNPVGATAPTNGTSFYNSGWSTGLELGGSQASFGSITSIPVSNMPFAEAVQATCVLDGTPYPNDTLINITSSGTFSNGDQLYLTFYYRTTLVDTNENPSLRTRWHEDASGGYIIPSFNLELTAEWQQYVAVVDASSSDKVRLNLAFGANAQMLEIGGLQVVGAPAGTFADGEFTVPQALQYPQQVSMLKTATLPVLSNDVDETGETFHITTLLSLPEHGTAYIDASGTNVVYTSTEDFFGIEEFEYAMADEYGNASSANIKLLVRHDFNDGTWHVGNDSAIYTGAVRIQNFAASDEYNSPYAYFGMGRGTSPDHAAAMDSHTDADTDFHYLIFGKLQPDGSIGFPMGWTWSIPSSQINDSYAWSGVKLGGSQVNHHGVYTGDILEWKFDIDVENYNLAYRRALLINTYWYQDPDGPIDGVHNAGKVMDLGIFFLDNELYQEEIAGDDGLTSIVVDGRNVYFKAAIKRFYVIIPDYDHFTLTDFDMAPYMHYLFDEGYQTEEGYLWGGAFDVELKHRVDSSTEKTTGEYFVHDFDFMVHLDMAAENPIPDLTFTNGNLSQALSLSNVFARRGGDLRLPDGQGGLIYETPTLIYSISTNSNGSAVSTSVNGSDLTLDIAPGESGIAEITVRATDPLNHWFDEETFQVQFNDDLDSDSLPDSWEQLFSSSLTNLTEQGNYDDDIHSDWEEYITGMNPTNAASFFHVTEFAPADAPGIVMEWTSVADRLYRISWSPTLTNTFTFFPGDVEYPQNSYTDTVHQADDKGFYKIDVRLK